MQISPAGLDFIKKQEFFVPYAYQDSAFIWTCGYGTTIYSDGVAVKKGDVISEEAALGELEFNVNLKIVQIERNIKVELNQNQQDAIISLVYNIGSAGFNRSTVLKLINKGPDNPIIRDAWMMWNKITYQGKLKVLPGLTHRREAEWHIYSAHVN